MKQRLAMCVSFHWAIGGWQHMDADLKYYHRRSVEESAAAEAARNSKVREIHLELARRYGDRILALNAASRQTSLHLVG